MNTEKTEQAAVNPAGPAEPAANPLEEFFGPIIYSYTRAQALEDEVLFDVSELAREAGVRYHTAVTAAVWQRVACVPEAVPWQSTSGRLWDLVWMFSWAAREAGDTNIVHFVVGIDDGQGVEEVTFKAVCGPGDEGEPVITIMLPHED